MVYVILFGFDSDEHYVSLKTAYSVYKELFAAGHSLLCVGVLKDGTWKYATEIDEIIKDPESISTIHINESCPTIEQIGNGMINNIPIKRVFIAGHGRLIEDGHVQGYLTLHNIPYTGCHLVGSAIGFNKYISKVIAQTYNVPVVPYIRVTKREWQSSKKAIVDIVRSTLGPHLIVKINTGGSSIGVYTCEIDTLAASLDTAFEKDTIVLVEQRLQIREISVGVIDGEFSDLIEIAKDNSFRTFDIKYNTRTEYSTSPLLTQELHNKIYACARILWEQCDLNGYARIDFFVTEDNSLFFNEINTLPGFTATSLFTKVWSNKYAYRELLEKILHI